MNARPLGNRIVVKPVSEEKESAGGIFIPDCVADQSNQAVVIAVGPGLKNKDGKIITMSVKVNDRIVMGKDTGHKIKLDSEDLVVVTEDDIFAVIEEGESNV
jgi:chaperonin GroES